MPNKKRRTAYLQGGKRECAERLQDVLRASVREALRQVMAHEIDSLWDPRCDPTPFFPPRKGAGGSPPTSNPACDRAASV